MRLAAIHPGDVVAIAGDEEPRLGEVRAKRRGGLTVAPWPTATTRDTAAVTVPARRVLSHYRWRARPPAADVGDLVLVDLRGRRFYARVADRPERGELRLDPITPHVSSFRVRPRNLKARWAPAARTASGVTVGAPGDG